MAWYNYGMTNKQKDCVLLISGIVGAIASAVTGFIFGIVFFAVLVIIALIPREN